MSIGDIICIGMICLVVVLAAIGTYHETKENKTTPITKAHNTTPPAKENNITPPVKENNITPSTKNDNIVTIPKPTIPQYTIDISGKKNVDNNKLCCLLLDKYSIQYFEALKNKNGNQTIVINGTRKRQKQTKYQVYTIDTPCITVHTTYDKLLAMGQSKIQQEHERNKITPALREKIKQRDNYTCQLCGKQMFDNVGLHIDHIIPISKGGKTVESNLQVLCSVCNLKKSDKIITTTPIDNQSFIATTKDKINQINDDYNLNAIFIQMDNAIQKTMKLGYNYYYFNITDYNLPQIAVERVLSHYNTDKFGARLYYSIDKKSIYIHLHW